MTANIVGHVRSRPHGGRVSGARACAVLLLLASGVIGCSGGEENAPPTTVAEVGPVFLDPNEPATWRSGIGSSSAIPPPGIQPFSRWLTRVVAVRNVR